MSDSSRPEYIPGQLVLEWKPEMLHQANPLGLAGAALELLTMLKGQHGAMKIEPLWPVGASVLNVARGPLTKLLLPKLVNKLPANLRPLAQELVAASQSAASSADPELAAEARLRLLVTLPPSEDVEAVVKKLAAAAAIDVAEPVPYLWSSPLDLPMNRQEKNNSIMREYPPRPMPTPAAGYWPVTNIRRPKAWDDLELDNIAVLDSGCDESHPGFNGAVDYANKESRVDEYGHGTFVAHVIAGRKTIADRKIGLDPKTDTDTTAGVLPKSRLWVANVFNSVKLDGVREYHLDLGRYSLELRRLLRMKKRIQVVNLSLGSVKDSSVIRKDLNDLLKAGLTVVAAAGNSPKGESLPVMYPAVYPSVISVGAIGYEGGIWRRSNRVVKATSREKPWDLCAPGEYVFSGLPMSNNRLGVRFSGWMHGTSMATPYVAAAVAVLRAQGVTAKDDIVTALAGSEVWGGVPALLCPQPQTTATAG